MLTGSAESVARSEFPHACEELSETTDAESHTDYNVRGAYSSRLAVDQRQDERRRREREQTTGVVTSEARHVINIMSGVGWHIAEHDAE